MDRPPAEVRDIFYDLPLFCFSNTCPQAVFNAGQSNPYLAGSDDARVLGVGLIEVKAEPLTDSFL